MSVSDADLSAYIDHRLDRDEARRVEDALDGDPQLRARLAAMKRVGDEGAELFARMDMRPLPDAVHELLHPQPEPSRPQALRPRARRWRLNWHLPRPVLAGAAMAGIGLAAIGVALVQMTGPGKGPAGSQGQLLVAGQDIAPGDPLYHVLDTARSGRPVRLDGLEGSDLRAVASLSFRSTRQDYCREIRVGWASGGRHGLACKREAKRWRVVASVETGPPPRDGYITASPDTAAPIEARIEALISGAPLHAEAEAAAIESGWRVERP